MTREDDFDMAEKIYAECKLSSRSSYMARATGAFSSLSTETRRSLTEHKRHRAVPFKLPKFVRAVVSGRLKNTITQQTGVYQSTTLIGREGWSRVQSGPIERCYFSHFLQPTITYSMLNIANRTLFSCLTTRCRRIIHWQIFQILQSYSKHVVALM